MKKREGFAATAPSFRSALLAVVFGAGLQAMPAAAAVLDDEGAAWMPEASERLSPLPRILVAVRRSPPTLRPTPARLM